MMKKMLISKILKLALLGLETAVQKCDGQTHRQTDRHTDIATYRKHRPKGRCFEKYGKFI